MTDEELRENIEAMIVSNCGDVNMVMVEIASEEIMQLIKAERENTRTIKVGQRIVEINHTAVNKDAHLFIDGDHDPYLCPECIVPGTLSFDLKSHQATNTKDNK